MPPARKLFTIDEANALVPFLQQRVDTLQKMVREVVRTKRQLEVLNLICDGAVSKQNRDFQDYVGRTAQYHRLIGEADALIQEIRARGCLLRDLQTGMVDLYAEIDGRVAFLCWRRGEQEIAYWHPVGEGYSKRRSIAGRTA